MTTSAIKTTGLTKAYDGVEVLSNLDLEVEAGEGARRPWTQWGRQDHHHPPAARLHPPDLGVVVDLQSRQPAPGGHGTQEAGLRPRRPICGRISPEPRRCTCSARSKGRSTRRTEMS